MAPIDSAPPKDDGTTRVWDPFVRIFHWSLVVAFALAFATGDDSTWIHIRLGWFIATLVAARLIWGFVGPRHARFTDFVRGPRAVFDYLRDMVARRPTRYLGHNPAGGAMVAAMLGMLAVVTVTGYMLTLDAWFGAEWLEGLHESVTLVMLAMITLHVAGVVVASLEHRENLVRAMVTGRKRIDR